MDLVPEMSDILALAKIWLLAFLYRLTVTLAIAHFFYRLPRCEPVYYR